jgi:diguanylate cyclase (GGDEF)-like protein
VAVPRDLFRRILGTTAGSTRFPTFLRSLAASIALLLAALPVAAEPAPWDGLATPLFTHLRRPEELPSIAMAIAQDKSGMIWIGTQSGLVRWDGYRPRLFLHDPDDGRSLPTNVITGLLVDEQGTLFVATVAGIVARYDPLTERFTSLPVTKSGTGLYPGFVGDGAGGLWLGDTNGLSYLAAGAGAWRDADLPAQAKVSSLLLGRDGTLWVGSNHGLLRRSAGADGFSTVGLEMTDAAAAAANITALYQAPDGAVWFGTNDGRVGALAGDGSIKRAQMPPTGNTIRSMVEVRPGVLCVGTRGGGLVFLDRASGKMLQHVRFDPLRPSGLASDDIYSLFVDRSGGQWIGHARGADYTIGSGAFLTLMPSVKDRSAISGSNAFAVVPRADGKVWIGTENGGADLLDPLTGRLMSLARQPEVVERALPASRVLNFAPSTEGRTWVATGQGLFESDGENVRRFAPLADSQVNALLSEDDRLWIGLENRGLARLDLSDRRVVSYQRGPADPLGISDNAVRDILRDPKHGLWVGTVHGLNLFDEESGHFHRFMHDAADPDSLPADYVVTLLLDRRHRLWVGMLGGGIAILEPSPGSSAGQALTEAGAGGAPRHFHHLSLAEGLPNDNVSKLLEDGDGRIWASTDHGVVMIDPSSLAIRAFDLADGVALNSHWVHSGGRTADGTLLFGGNGGVTVVHPDRLSNWTHQPSVAVTQPSVVVTAIRVGGHGIPTTGPVILPPGEHSLQVEFAALDYSAPDRNRYAYRLVGFDDDWIATDAAHRLAAYTNLPPSRYKLLVRGSNRNGQWIDPPTELAMTVLPAWYQTLWFKIICGAVGIAAVAALVQIRTAFLRRRQRDLEALIAERTADLERISVTDQLTGLFNRRKLDETLLQEMERGKRYGQTFSIVIADVDKFKSVNDRHGHQAGDMVLVSVANVLRQGVRKTDTIGRWGGEEFMVICPNTDLDGAVALAKHLRLLVEASEFSVVGRKTCSFGVAQLAKDEPVESLVSRTDVALYRAKTGGRNRVEADHGQP